MGKDNTIHRAIIRCNCGYSYELEGTVAYFLKLAKESRSDHCPNCGKFFDGYFAVPSDELFLQHYEKLASEFCKADQ